MYEKERQRREATEILRLAGCLDNIDNDVADLCLKVMPKGKNKLISMADLMSGVQKIKEKLKKSLSTLPKAKELNSSSKKDCFICPECGEKYPDDIIYCICGTRLKRSPS